MRILALDLGDKTIGVAVSDALQITAQGLDVIRRSTEARDFARLAEIIVAQEVDTVIVGLPKNMNGTIGERGEISRQFSEKLSGLLPDIKVKLWDERLSTKAAERYLLEADLSRKKRRQVIDKMAAVFILQGYLESIVCRDSVKPNLDS